MHETLEKSAAIPGRKSPFPAIIPLSIMDRTPTSVPTPSTVRRPPAFVGVEELRALLRAKAAPALLDVREPAQFHPRHLRGSLNCPESQATALVLRVQALGKAVLICEDGSRSSVVTRTLG